MNKELTTPQKRLLQKLYYREGNLVGQKRLFQLSKKATQDLGITPIESRQVLVWLKNQEVHQLMRRQRRVKTYRPIVGALKVGRIFQMDFTYMTKPRTELPTSKPKKASGILVAVDVLSKKIYTKAIKTDVASRHVVQMLKDQIPKTIKVLLSDNGSEFQKETKTYLKEHKIKHITGRANVPFSQGLVERCNMTIKTLLYKWMKANNDTKDWSRGLPIITKNYNNTFNRIIMMTPNEVNDTNAKEVGQRLRDNYPSYQANTPAYKVGDRVRLRIDKIKDKFSKGYTQNWTNETYKIKKVKLLKGVYTYKVEGKPKPYYKNDLVLANIVEKNPYIKEVPKRPRQKPTEEIEDEPTTRELRPKVIIPPDKPQPSKGKKKKQTKTKTYEIEKLVRRFKKGKYWYYEIKWVGYPSSQNEEEPRFHLMKQGAGVVKLVKEFEKKLRNK